MIGRPDPPFQPANFVVRLAEFAYKSLVLILSSPEILVRIVQLCATILDLKRCEPLDCETREHKRK